MPVCHDDPRRKNKLIPGDFVKWRASRRMAECKKPTLRRTVIRLRNSSQQSLIQNVIPEEKLAALSVTAVTRDITHP